MKATIRCVLAVCLLTVLPHLAQAQTDYKTWYLAEGSTGMFQEEILFANPNVVAANVRITYLVGPNETAPVPRDLQVPPTGRATVQVPAGYGQISAIVTSDQAIIVERSMYVGTARTAGHNSTGVTAAAPEWYLAEGSNGWFDTYVLVANPNAVPVNVEITFLGSDGVTKVHPMTIQAMSRDTVHARLQAGVTSPQFSARVRSLDSSRPIIVERAMYWRNFSGATNEKGLTALSSTWRFGEGFTGSGFTTWVLLANPNDAEANVTTTFYLEDRTTKTDTRTVPARSRAQFSVGELDGMAGKAFSIKVECTNGLDIAAERAMYLADYREGHDVAGIAAEANTWGFAEGIQGNFANLPYDTYFLLGNSSATDVRVTATFMLEDGTGFQDTFTVNANSRKTISAVAYLQLSNKRFAAFFESSGPIVAERSVYWGAPWFGAHASAGTPWTLPIVAPTNAPAGPTVASITPSYGSTNGGTTVTITGTNFRRDASVTVGGAAAQNVVVRDAETITFTTPRSTAGAKQVAVSSFGSTATNKPSFTYETPPPPPPPPSSSAAQGDPVAIYCNGFASNGVCTSVVTWPFPQNMGGVIAQLARDRPDLLFSSCTETGGNNRFMFEAVRRLRSATGTNRWAMNIKRGNQGLSQDIVTYFYGPRGTEMENDIRVYLFDIIGGHCGPSPSWNWADVTDATRAGGTIGRWTTAGQTF